MKPKLSRVAKIQGRAAFSKEAYGSSWQHLSTTVREQASWQCSKCHKSMFNNKQQLHAHHIIPLSKGGSNAQSNLIALCADCHSQEHQH